MLLKNLIDLLFPKLCLGCKNPLYHNEYLLCVCCRHQLPFTQQQRYSDNASYRKFYGRLPLEHCSSMLYFTKKGIVQQLLHQMKYKNHPEVSYFLGLMYAELLKEHDFLKHVDQLIPVPLHPKKLKQRGYNQVDGFATALSQRFCIPINRQLLYKTRQTTSQTQKNLFGRTQNLEERFDIRNHSGYAPQHFLLLDDILTSGGTLESCGKKLLQIPQCKLSILCLAQSV